MRHLISVLSFVALLYSCGTNQTAEHENTTTSPPTQNLTTHTSDTADFKQAFGDFFAALQHSDTAALNQFIHPEHGLWVIEQPGALPKITQVQRIQTFKRVFKDRSFFSVAQEVAQCELSEEKLPSFDCAAMEGGNTGFAKDGCFVWDAANFKESGYWNYASLTQNQLQSIHNALPLVQKTVLHTASSFEFHFGYLDGQWYLLFAKLIYPCSA